MAAIGVMTQQMLNKEHYPRYKDMFDLPSIPENLVADSDIHFVRNELTYINLCTPQSVSGGGEEDNSLSWLDDPFNSPAPPYQNEAPPQEIFTADAQTQPPHQNVAANGKRWKNKEALPQEIFPQERWKNEEASFIADISKEFDDAPKFNPPSWFFKTPTPSPDDKKEVNPTKSPTWQPTDNEISTLLLKIPTLSPINEPARSSKMQKKHSTLKETTSSQTTTPAESEFKSKRQHHLGKFDEQVRSSKMQKKHLTLKDSTSSQTTTPAESKSKSERQQHRSPDKQKKTKQEASPLDKFDEQARSSKMQKKHSTLKDLTSSQTTTTPAESKSKSKRQHHRSPDKQKKTKQEASPLDKFDEQVRSSKMQKKHYANSHCTTTAPTPKIREINVIPFSACKETSSRKRDGSSRTVKRHVTSDLFQNSSKKLKVMSNTKPSQRLSIAKFHTQHFEPSFEMLERKIDSICRDIQVIQSEIRLIKNKFIYIIVIHSLPTRIIPLMGVSKEYLFYCVIISKFSVK